MNRHLRLILIAALSLVFVISLGGALWGTLVQQKEKEAYQEANSLIGEPDFTNLLIPTLDPLPESPETDPESVEPPEDESKQVYTDPYANILRTMDFSALQEINPDVLGWILIPGTNISYPLLQGRDNDQYLRHNWKGQYSRMGSIFLESLNSSSLQDFNTIAYGHRMRNETMFGTLKYYNKLSYWRSHPCVYITNHSGIHKYNIFAAYKVSVTGLTYRLSFSGSQAKQEYIDWCLSQSVIDTGLIPAVSDKILTLSTCSGDTTYSTRWIVQAYMPGPAPEETGEDLTETAPAEPLPEAQPPEAPSLLQ